MAESFQSIVLYNSLAWLGGNGIIWGLCLYGCTVVLMDGYQKGFFYLLFVFFFSFFSLLFLVTHSFLFFRFI